MRCFIAINANSDKLVSLTEELKNIDRGVKSVSHGNLHITLKFLGEISEEQIKNIKTVMEESVKSLKSFTYFIKGTGTLPSKSYIRVIYTDVADGKEKLIEIHSILENELVKLGFEKDKRIFTPHITLARVKSSGARKHILDFIEKHEKEELGRINVTKISLMRSTLKPSGPVYEPIEEIELENLCNIL